MRRSRDRACEGKQGHDTRAQAQAHMHNLIRKGNVLLEVYRCPWCDKYHVGHRSRGRKRSRRKR
jgi:hypothetical protein